MTRAARLQSGWASTCSTQQATLSFLYTLTHTPSQTHTCLHVPLPPATEKPYSPNVQCPLSVNISSIPTLMWQDLTRAQNSEALHCNQMFPTLSSSSHGSACLLKDLGNSACRDCKWGFFPLKQQWRYINIFYCFPLFSQLTVSSLRTGSRALTHTNIYRKTLMFLHGDDSHH